MSTQDSDIPQEQRKRNPHRKFLCVVDASPECSVAVQFASRRAMHTKGGVTLLYVIEPAEFQHWASVKDIMLEEARDEAQEVLRVQAARVQDVSGAPAEIVLREGKIAEQLRELVREDHDIRVLVLGAAVGKEGPGPMVASIGVRDTLKDFPIPVTIVPGHLTMDEINSLA